MKKGHLSEYFADFAFKKLSAVEAHRYRSNQHEFDGVSALKRMLGDARRTFQARFLYLQDDDPDPVSDAAWLTWYDAREKHPRRTEWRLYFPDTMVSDNANEGDLLLIARLQDDTLMVIVAEADSTIERQILWLFGAGGTAHPGFSVKGEVESDSVKLEFASSTILEQIGITVENTDASELDRMVERFGMSFPPAEVFSAFARASVGDIDVAADPDAAIMAWVEREEILFRTMERHLIGAQLQASVHQDGTSFRSFSEDVQARRRIRAGGALASHLQATFDAIGIRHDLRFPAGGGSDALFLLPSERAWLDPAFPDASLTVLAANPAIRDRWKLLLQQHCRSGWRHLLTLEPALGTAQTGEMIEQRVQPVIPRPLWPSFTPDQTGSLMDLATFAALARGRQAAG